MPDPDKVVEWEEALRDVNLELELLAAQELTPDGDMVNDYQRASAAYGYADSNDITIQEAIDAGAVYQDAEGQWHAYSLEDNDPGDNVPGDGFAYSYHPENGRGAPSNTIPR